MKARFEITDLRSKDGFAMAATLGVLTLLSVLVISVFANAMADGVPLTVEGGGSGESPC